MERLNVLFLLALLICSVVSACGTTRKAEHHEYLRSGGVTLSVDTTRTYHTVEVINEFSRDTVVRTIYRETTSEQRGVATLADTVYIHNTDTVFQEPDHTAVLAKSAPWCLFGGAALSLVVLVLVIILRR